MSKNARSRDFFEQQCLDLRHAHHLSRRSCTDSGKSPFLSPFPFVLGGTYTIPSSRRRTALPDRDSQSVITCIIITCELNGTAELSESGGRADLLLTSDLTPRQDKTREGTSRRVRRCDGSHVALKLPRSCRTYARQYDELPRSCRT